MRIAAVTLLLISACGPAASKTDGAPMSGGSAGMTGTEVGAGTGGTAGSTGTGGSSSTSGSGMLSACVAQENLPLNCDELCAAQGQTCNQDGCPVAGGLDSTTAFYSSLANCEQDRPSMTELAGCDSSLADAAQLFLSFTHVRCCCTGGAPTTSFASLIELCRTACEKTRPDFTNSPECADGVSCDDSCLDAVAGSNDACARCIADSVIWMPGGCGERECWCPPPTFAMRNSAQCAQACAMP